LLTSQLDSQRSFYEEQTTELRTQIDELKSLVEKLSNEFAREQVRNEEQEARIRKEEEEKVSQIAKERAKTDHRAEKVSELARRLEKELREERAVSESLMKNLGKLKEKAELADKEKDKFTNKVRDLEDQLRDVMFFLEAKTKIEQGDGVESEAAGGSIAVPTPSPTHPMLNGKKKKARKR
jgi:BRCA1-associated protein